MIRTAESVVSSPEKIPFLHRLPVAFFRRSRYIETGTYGINGSKEGVGNGISGIQGDPGKIEA